MFLVNLIIASIPIKALVLSLIVPGLGELQLGDRHKGIPFMAIEGISWISFATLKLDGTRLEQNYKIFAYRWAGASTQREDESYWQAIEFNINYDEYLEKLRREARSLYPDSPSKQNEYVQTHNVGGTWDWQSENLWFEFQELRAKHRSLQDWASVSIGVMVANRIMSALNVLLLNRSGGKLSLRYNMGKGGFAAGISINGLN